MSEITKEVYEQLPEVVQSEYTEVDGVYKHAGVLKLKSSLNEVDSKYKRELSEKDSILAQIEANKQAEIEAATQRALEEAQKNNDVESILRIEKEKLADKERLIEEEKEKFNAEKESLKAAHSSTFSKKLANELATDSGSLAFELLIKSRFDTDHLGNKTFLNSDGSASSLDEQAFIEELKKDKVLAPLMKAGIVTDSANLIKGSKSGSAAKNPKDMTTAERLEFKQRDPAGFKKAFNL